MNTINLKQLLNSPEEQHMMLELLEEDHKSTLSSNEYETVGEGNSYKKLKGTTLENRKLISSFPDQ